MIVLWCQLWISLKDKSSLTLTERPQRHTFVPSEFTHRNGFPYKHVANFVRVLPT